MIGMDAAAVDALLARASGAIQKSTINTGTGISMYDLEVGLKQIYPVLAPFRNKDLPRRVSPIGGLTMNAKLLTAIGPSQGGLGLAEGKRGGLVSVVEQDLAVAYRTVGQDESVTFEAEEVAQGFDDARAIASTTLLNSNLMEEERLVLFGNGGNIASFGGTSRVTALGTPSPVVVGASATPGTLPAASYQAYVVALTHEGYRFASVAQGVSTSIVRTNVGDGSTTTIPGGSSNVSAASNTFALGAAGSVALTVPFVQGANAYAWYLGTSKATATLAAITGQNYVTISAPPAGTQVATAITADNSVNPYVYDGIITQMMNPNSGCYQISLNGANLTADGAGGIVEIEVALKYMWDTYRIGVQKMYVGSGMAQSIKAKIISGGGAPLFRFNADGDGQRVLSGGGRVGTYFNQYTNEMVDIEVHPYFPAGMIWGFAKTLPYQTAKVPVPYRFQARTRDWYEIEWPINTRERFHGQYVSAAMISYTPWAGFLILNAGSN